ncbi:UDP-N-acetylmuramate dehydrogenase [Dyadobacter sp. CY312]|uniref:UDP-N-acetylmuramate dehydrogenase n=1 Tax=Dyadobacter sp. CY312 TaxID=2907303 RepID=UPI001F197F8E|nr:UDP-N-acetylmuramate dehydrogenase [Dyadobacter sp. CY312]MCE7042230.1 UDP-N-acetylmuramate dehydrogenase [Dyadobacter sp. CY312]
MEIKQHVSLRDLNTFGLESEARYFADVKSEADLQSLLRNPRYLTIPRFILGGGSNVLFTQNIDALVIHPNIKGIEVVKEDDLTISLNVGGGEVWHELVLYCVNNNYAGIENLSLIPGTVGAAPMQNIGAYGVEVKDVIESVRAISIDNGEVRVFDNEECQFGYRESIFKKELKDHYIITGVVMKLQKVPVFRVEYGDIRNTLAEMQVKELSIGAISNAVIRIRQSKLPDPARIGNAGSFFKNPEIDQLFYNSLKEQFPNMPGYPTEPGKIKVPAGWLIEQAGWKGYREGQIGVHERQALVLVNYGGGRGEDIKLLSEKIKISVADKFGIQLSTEVNFV